MVDTFNFSPLDFLIFFLFLLINWLLSGPFPKSYKEVNNTLVLHSWILPINTQALRVAKECPFLQQCFRCSLSSLISNPSMTFIYSQVRIFSSVGNRRIFIAFSTTNCLNSAVSGTKGKELCINEKKRDI